MKILTPIIMLFLILGVNTQTAAPNEAEPGQATAEFVKKYTQDRIAKDIAFRGQK